MVRRYNRGRIPAKYNREDIPDTSDRIGVVQKKFRSLDMTIGVNTFTPEIEPNPHSHPWEQVNYILDGKCDFHVDGETLEAGRGDIFFIPPDVTHYIHPPDAECTILVMGPLREDSVDRVEYQEEFA